MWLINLMKGLFSVMATSLDLFSLFFFNPRKKNENSG